MYLNSNPDRRWLLKSTAVFHFNVYNLALSKINKRKIRVVTQIDHK